MTLQSPGARSSEIASLGPWFHNLHLPDGLETAPDHPLGDYPAFKWAEIEPHLPDDLDGWSALDVGCNAGFFTFELARRGARVVGIDADEHYLRQARWAQPLYGLDGRVEFRHMQVYDLARHDERYDLVLFMGVLYHLRHPLLALDLIAQRTRRLLVLQTLTIPADGEVPTPLDIPFRDRGLLAQTGWPAMAFIEHRLAGDPTNWWAPNAACVDAMARSAGFEPFARTSDELVLCRRKEPAWGVEEELGAVFGS